MNHPPTRCDRELIFDSSGKPIKVQPDDIAKAVSWYEHNWLRISESLPIAISGHTYKERWQDVMDRQTLPAYRAGDLSHRKAVAYVYWALKRIARGLRDRASP